MILLDLDGVLADFTGGANDVHGRPLYVVAKWDWYSDWGMSDDEFWEPIKQLGHCFYARHVPQYPWAADLLRLVKDYIIVTANPLHSGLASGKTDWIRKHIGYDAPVITTCSGGNFHAADLKAMLAGPDRILIDDSDENVAAFRAAGGKAITFPQPWNKAHAFTKHRIEFVKDCLLRRGEAA